MHNGETPPSADRENYFQKYLQYASFLLSSYKGREPFHLYLKKYFSRHRKHGSKDRKMITALCYNYFRLGAGVIGEGDPEQSFLLAVYLCENVYSPLLAFFKPEWSASIDALLPQKISTVRGQFDGEHIFPFNDELSGQINIQGFNNSFLLQPKVFIRVRPGYQAQVTAQLKDASIVFDQLPQGCIAVKNNQKIDTVVELDTQAVVQDYNSQRTLDFLRPIFDAGGSEKSVWDACAGSGGKSILAFDQFRNVLLTVTDIRKNILENLKKRFEKAGLSKYHLAVADLEKTSGSVPGDFEVIIADVPCSGSGTWSRTPEQLRFFKRGDIKKYATLQRRIVGNAVRSLKDKGYLLYITCSVFRKENEENIAFFQQALPLKLLQADYLKGYDLQADTLFAALFVSQK